MRHHSANVTLSNYSYSDNKQSGGELLALETAEKSPAAVDTPQPKAQKTP